MGFGLKGFCPFGDSCKYLHPKNNPPQNTGNQGLRGIFLPLHLLFVVDVDDTVFFHFDVLF